MNKITKYLISLVSLILVVFGVYYVVKGSGSTTDTSTNPDIIEIPEEQFDELITHVKTDENLIIDFETPIDPDSLHEASIQVFDENENQVNSTIELMNNHQTIRIVAPEENYEKNHLYHITLAEDVKFSKSEQLPTERTYYFKTERDPVEEAVLNPDLKFIDASAVSNFTEESVTLLKEAIDDVVVDDILIVPVNDDGEQKEKAIIVTEISKKEDTYELQYGTPYFEDIYESIDIYGTYNIEASHIELADPSFKLDTLYVSKPNNLFASTENVPMTVDELQDHPFRKEVPHDFNQVHIIDIGKKEYSFGDSSFTLSGDIKILQPYIDHDIGFNQSMNIKEWLALDVVVHLGEEKNLKSDISTSFSESNVDFLNLDEEIRIGNIKVPFPSAPGMFFEFEIVLRLQTDARGAVSVSTSYRSLGKYGISLHKGDLSFVNDKFSDYQANSISGSGEAELLYEMGIYGGLSGFDVFGVGLEGVLGMESEASAHAMDSTKANEVDQGLATSIDQYFAVCGEGAYALYSQIYFDLGFRGLIRETLKNYPVGVAYEKSSNNYDLKVNERGLRLAMLRHVLAEGETGNCTQLIELTTDQEEIELSYDDQLETQLLATTVDVSKGFIKEEILKDDDIRYTVEDEDIAQVSYNDGYLNIITDEKPAGPETMLTVEYLGKAVTDAESTIEIPITIKNYDELNPLVKKDGKSTMSVDDLVENSLYTFTGMHNDQKYHVYFYADNETNEEIQDLGFIGEAGDMMASGDYSFYLSADGEDVAYKQDHLEKLSYTANREDALYETLALEDTTIFSVFENEGVRHKSPYSFIYKDGELYDLNMKDEIGSVYFPSFEHVEGNIALATDYILSIEETFWRYITFEVDVEKKRMRVVDVEEVDHHP